MHNNNYQQPEDQKSFRLNFSKSQKLPSTASPAPLEETAEIPDPSVNSFTDCAEKIFKQVRKDCLVLPDGNYCLLRSDLPADTAHDSSIPAYISGYMGIALFCCAFASYGRTPDLKEHAKDMADHLLIQLEEEIRLEEKGLPSSFSGGDSSFASGTAGMIYALECMRSFMDPVLCQALQLRLLSFLPDSNKTPFFADLIIGAAGLLKVLCLKDEFLAVPGVRELALSLGENLLERRRKLADGTPVWYPLWTKIALSGAAHGQIGIGSALFIAGEKLDRPDFTSAARQALAYEEALYLQTGGAWPDLRLNTKPGNIMHGYCSGAPGIGFEAISLADPTAAKLTEQAITVCLNHDLLPLDHLCCGNCAAIDFLLEAGLRQGRPELTLAARDRLTALLERAGSSGEFHLPEIHTPQFLMNSLSHGLSGVGYTFLRGAYPHLIPSPLL